MASTRPFLDLPLHAVGISTACVNWLRQLGLPTAELTPAQIAGDDSLTSGRGVVICDPQNRPLRPVLRRLEKSGHLLLDVRRLSGETAASPDRTRILPFRRATEKSPSGNVAEFLKSQIEQAGYTWIRLADYPFPYQSACIHGDPRRHETLRPLSGAFSPLQNDQVVKTDADLGGSHVLADDPSSMSDGTLRWIDRSNQQVQLGYEAGIPLVTAKPASLAATEFPLLWQTSADDFSRWWQTRSRIDVRVTRDGAACRIECDSDFNGFRPMLEVWRGQHVAAFRLFPGVMSVSEAGLVFQGDHSRHAGGFLARSPLTEDVFADCLGKAA